MPYSARRLAFELSRLLLSGGSPSKGHMVLPSPFLDLVLPRKIIHNLCCPVQQRVLNENIMPRTFYVTDLELHNLKKKLLLYPEIPTALSWFGPPIPHCDQ